MIKQIVFTFILIDIQEFFYDDQNDNIGTLVNNDVKIKNYPF